MPQNGFGYGKLIYAIGDGKKNEYMHVLYTHIYIQRASRFITEQGIRKDSLFAIRSNEEKKKEKKKNDKHSIYTRRISMM